MKCAIGWNGPVNSSLSRNQKPPATFVDPTILDRTFQQRSSCRAWTSQPVDFALINWAARLADSAPSGGGKKPWRVVICDQPDLIEEITQCVERVNERLSAIDIEMASGESGNGVGFFRSAPVLALVAINPQPSKATKAMQRFPNNAFVQEVKRRRDVGNSRVQSAAAWISFFILALTIRGLGTCWLGSLQIAGPDIAELVAMPSEWTLVAGLAVGWPADAEQRPVPPWPRDRIFRNYVSGGTEDS